MLSIVMDLYNIGREMGRKVEPGMVMCGCYPQRRLRQEDHDFLGYSVTECLSRMHNGQYGKKVIVIKVWNQPGGPPTDKWTRKMYVHVRTFYSAEKKVQQSRETGKQTELGGCNMLSEISQVQRERDIFYRKRKCRFKFVRTYRCVYM